MIDSKAKGSREFRVRYQREGHRPKERRYVREKLARRFLAVLRDPSLERPPDNLEGEGMVYDAWIAAMPPILWARVEEREVGQWMESR